MDIDTPSPSDLSAPAVVRLVGGPDDWHGQTITGVYTAADLAGPRETLGTHLITSGVPDGHPDPGARAVYTPDPDPADVERWYFRGWHPAVPARRAASRAPAEVELDAHGEPVAWSVAGQRVALVRVEVHWAALDGEPAEWLVRGDDDRVWDLVGTDDGWTAGTIG
jgi:hypothetical protein